MKIQDAYTRWSDTYDLDGNLTRDLDQAVTKESLAHRRFHTILEIGCGTGKNTALFAQICERVLGLDLSAGMLQQAKGKINLNHVFFSVADLTKPWPCKAESVELVVCNLVLEHIQNLVPVFAEAYRALSLGGQFFICELHPFRQYHGTQANFQKENERIEIQAFVHHLSDFTDAAAKTGLSLQSFKEWWHENDKNKPPRLVSFMFQKGSTK
jgi:ubiquinone/menaquinone biosynthesis C-methylase UbiE